MTARPSSSRSILSIDVEDWFHILDVPSAPDPAAWASLPSRVESNFQRLLDLLQEHSVHATCFFLGFVAEQFPHLVKEAAARGHEIASHGYSHQLVYTMTPAEFRADAIRSRETPEQICGQPVRGYRCAGFSVTAATPWFFDELLEAGYQYDSSVFPAPRGHGGMRTARLHPHWCTTSGPQGRLLEFPITVVEVLGRPICFFGGGYLRLFPYPVILRMARRVEAQRRPVIFYVHPREVDPLHPRLPMNPLRRFKSYVNLSSTEPKLRRMMKDFRLTTFKDYIANHEEWRGAST